MAESAPFRGRTSPTTPGYGRAVSRLAPPPAAAASAASDASASAAATPHIIPDARVAGGTGVVILSEFSMASQCLNGVFRINPYAIDQIASCLDRALSMSPAEKLSRMSRDFDAVSTCSAAAWSRQLLYDLKVGSVDERRGEEGMIDVDGTHTASKSARDDVLHASSRHHVGADVVTPHGVTAHRATKMHGSLFSEINVGEVSDAYSGAKRRLLFFDWGGTLVEKENRNLYSKHDFLGISHRKPSVALLDALKALCTDPANVVVVITALPRQVLLAQLNAVPEVVLAAENGRFVAIPPSKEGYSKAFQAVIKQDRRNAASIGGGEFSLYPLHFTRIMLTI